MRERAAEGVDPSFAAVRRRGELDDVLAHAEDADLVVAARVVRLEAAAVPALEEHDPHWWVARLLVERTERGDDRTGVLDVLYPNSTDVRWYRVPKPLAGQEGLWFLHASDRELADLASFQLRHPEDHQSAAGVDVLRAERG